jgi:hypothetical protein
MEKKEILKYEAPFIAEFISIGWMQDVIARYIAWKVNRKWKRYLYREDRENGLESINHP